MIRKLLLPLTLTFAAFVEPSVHAQILLKAGGTAKVGVDEASEDASTTAGLQKNIKALQDNIRQATDRLRDVGKSTSERIKELDTLTESVKVALKEVSANGGLYSELDKAIKDTEARSKAYHDKSVDSKFSAKMQKTYAEMKEELSKERDKLYRSQMAMDRQRSELEKQLQNVIEHKELVIDLLSLKNIRSANKAVMDVVNSMGEVSASFDGLLKDIVKAGIDEKTQ